MVKSLKSRKWPVMLWVRWILIVSLLAGCVSKPETRKNVGTLKLSTEVSEIFQSYQVLPGHRYYFYGSATKPRAIVGIDQNYSFDSRLWKAAPDLTSEQLKKWVDQILAFLPPVRTFGAYILDPGGDQVGIWYSPYPDAPVIVQPDKRINIIPHTSFPKAGR